MRLVTSVSYANRGGTVTSADPETWVSGSRSCCACPLLQRAAVLEISVLSCCVNLILQKNSVGVRGGWLGSSHTETRFQWTESSQEAGVGRCRVTLRSSDGFPDLQKSRIWSHWTSCFSLTWAVSPCSWFMHLRVRSLPRATPLQMTSLQMPQASADVPLLPRAPPQLVTPLDSLPQAHRR